MKRRALITNVSIDYFSIQEVAKLQEVGRVQGRMDASFDLYRPGGSVMHGSIQLTIDEMERINAVLEDVGKRIVEDSLRP